MKKVLLFTVLLSAALLNQAIGQDATVFTKGGMALTVTNTGNNTIVDLNKADSVFTFGMAAASFLPGKRLDWHHHAGGQIMIITEGIGYYQERDKLRQIVRKGEVIKCLPGVEHWHGASAEVGVTYMAANPSQKGATVWLEKVTDAQYFGSISPKK